MAVRKVGQISIDLVLGTGTFTPATENAARTLDRIGNSAGSAGRKVIEMGHASVTGVQATTGALRVLEGGYTNNLRAAERFTANVLGLGPILQKAFPLIGAIAFTGLIIRLGQEIQKFYTEMRDAPEKVAAAFRDLNAPLKLTNDEMLVTNDRLRNQIALLEGRRQNTLKLALDEIAVSADKLADSLNKGLESLNKLLPFVCVATIFGEAILSGSFHSFVAPSRNSASRCTRCASRFIAT